MASESEQHEYKPVVKVIEVGNNTIEISVDGVKYYHNGRNCFRMDEYGDYKSIRRESIPLSISNLVEI